MDLVHILESFELQTVSVSAFKSAEDGSDYNVWRINTEEREYVLKLSSTNELSVYQNLLANRFRCVPKLYGHSVIGDNTYILMESVPGSDLRYCQRKELTAALDALICLQESFWDKADTAGAGISFEESLNGRSARGKYLNDPLLEKAYSIFLDTYLSVPRTLCHDDLLPFNLLISNEQAVIIDWEYAGILPYPVSIARLIAHGEETEGAFFYMTAEDKSYAIDYYYENLVKNKGISYTDYRNALDLFLLYEYCEWVMLGNRYPDADMSRFHRYLAKARAQAKCCLGE